MIRAKNEQKSYAHYVDNFFWRVLMWITKHLGLVMALFLELFSHFLAKHLAYEGNEIDNLLLHKKNKS